MTNEPAHSTIAPTTTVLGFLDERADVGPTWRGGPRICVGRVGNSVEVAVTEPNGATGVVDFHVYRTEGAKIGFEREVNRREQYARQVLAAFPPMAVDTLADETRYYG